MTERSGPSLSRREQQVLAAVAQGLRNRDIARNLGISEHTVKRHLSRALQKLQLPNRAAAAAWWSAHHARTAEQGADDP